MMNKRVSGLKRRSRFSDMLQLAPLHTYLSCVSPAVTPLLQSPVSIFQLLFESGSLCTEARGQQCRGGTRRPLSRREVLPDICAHTIQTYKQHSRCERNQLDPGVNTGLLESGFTHLKSCEMVRGRCSLIGQVVTGE